MRIRRIISCLIATTLVLPIEGVAQQSASANNWAAITTVRSGEKLIIELKTGKELKGKFGSASETAVTLVRGKNTEDINRSDIRKVYRENGVSATKSTLIGTAIGGGSGAVLGAAAGGCHPGDIFCTTRGETAAILGVLGAGIGAITGFVVGKLRQKKVLMYEVK
jgi:hypothetical protein